jgi:NADPH-dependent 2,4-dienoyl-CoA reductase/sulfur reductase-like enzyme
MTTDVIVIGAGAAGMAAAIKAKEEGASVLLVEREDIKGGILNQCIHNGFGLSVFKEELTGPEYAGRYQVMMAETDIAVMTGMTVTDIRKDNGLFDVVATGETHGLIHLSARAVVLSTGCYERTRGAIRIPGDRPKGIMPAGSAQRYLNIDGYLVGERVFILGSGDIGLIMARRMTLEGAKVLGVAEIMPHSNGLTRNIVQCLDDFDIPLYLSHTVTDIEGKDVLESVTISQVDPDFNPVPGTEKRFEVDTLLLSVGLIPDVQLFEGLPVDLSKKTGSATVDQTLETTVSGLYVCGNALHVHDLVDFVSLEAEQAGLHAARHAQGKTQQEKAVLNVVPGKFVHHTVPSRVLPGKTSGQVSIAFRTTRKASVARFVLSQNGRIIKDQTARHVAPAEMASVTFDLDALDPEGDIVLDMEVRAS